MWGEDSVSTTIIDWYEVTSIDRYHVLAAVTNFLIRSFDRAFYL